MSFGEYMHNMHAQAVNAKPKDLIAQELRDACSRYIVDPSDDNWLQVVLFGQAAVLKANIELEGGLEKFLRRMKEVRTADNIMNKSHREQ